MTKLLTIAAMLTVAAPLSALAYTQEDIDACTPDAIRLCQRAFPNKGRVVRCLVKNKRQLNAACTLAFIGIIGAFIWSWLMPQLGSHLGSGMVPAIVNATVGAVLLLFVLRLVRGANGFGGLGWNRRWRISRQQQFCGAAPCLPENLRAAAHFPTTDNFLEYLAMIEESVTRPNPAYLRLQADRCQRLSRSCMDLATARDLRLMAEEYSGEASRIDAEASGSQLR